MKKLDSKTFVLAALLVFGLGISLPNSVFATDNFKGTPSDRELDVGAMAGLGIIDSTAAVAIIGSVAKKVVHQGFVPDINDQVFVELELGPAFAKGTTSLIYSTHLRWDFQRDSEWTFYALGGLGGNVTGETLGDRWALFPRFGVGAFWDLGYNFRIRGELSHELIIAGVSWGF